MKIKLITLLFVLALCISIPKALFIIHDRINTIEKELESMKPRSVILTAYNSMENQTDSTPNETAFLTPVCSWCVAASRDLINDGWLPGDRVYFYRIENGNFRGLGVFLITDMMHDRKKNQFDIWVPTLGMAEKIGRMKDVKAILLKI